LGGAPEYQYFGNGFPDAGGLSLLNIRFVAEGTLFDGNGLVYPDVDSPGLCGAYSNRRYDALGKVRQIVLAGWVNWVSRFLYPILLVLLLAISFA